MIVRVMNHSESLSKKLSAKPHCFELILLMVKETQKEIFIFPQKATTNGASIPINKSAQRILLEGLTLEIFSSHPFR